MATITSTELGASGRYINLGTPAALANLGSCTILIYTRPTGSGENGYSYAYGKTPTGSTSGHRMFIGHNAGSPQLAFGSHSTGTAAQPLHDTTANQVTYNSWQHNAMVWDGSVTAANIKLYRGVGADLTECSYSQNLNGTTAIFDDSSQPAFLMNRYGLGRAFVGDVAYIAIWDHELTLTELVNAQNNGPLSEYTGLVLLWANQADLGPNALSPSSRSTYVAGAIPPNTALGTAPAGPQTLTPDILANTNTFYSPTVTTGGVTITPDIYNNTNTFYQPVVGGADLLQLYPEVLANTNTFYSPSISVGDVSLQPDLLQNSNTFYTASVIQSVTFDDEYERSNINIPLSSIVQDAYQPTITIFPRVQLSDNNPAYAQYVVFHTKLIGVNGKRPNFQVRVYQTPSTTLLQNFGLYTTQRFMYSYDRVTWVNFDSMSADADGLHYNFAANSDFTANTVYVATIREFNVTDTTNWVTSLASTYPSYVSMPGSSAGSNYVLGTVSQQTDERGRTIPAQPLYSFKITDSSQNPDDGSPKRVAVLMSGVHSGEDLGNLVLKGAVEFLLSGDAKAVAARKNFEFLVYPMVNPSGRYGGHWRGDFNAAHPTYDSNRRWLPTPDMECITKTKTAIESDIGGRPVSVLFDFHMGSSTFFTYSAGSLYNAWKTKRDLYTPGLFTAGARPNYTASWWAETVLFAPVCPIIEIGIASPISDANIVSHGSASLKAVVDMFADNAFPYLVPSTLTNTNTFFSHTATAGDITLSPNAITNDNTFYAPSVVIGELVYPDTITNTNTFYTPAVSAGEVNLSPDTSYNSNTFFQSEVLPGSVTLTPSIVDNTNVFYSIVVENIVPAQDLTPDTFYGSNVFYSHTVDVGGVTLTQNIFNNTNIFYTHSLVGGNIVRNYINKTSYFTVRKANTAKFTVKSNKDTNF